MISHLNAPAEPRGAIESALEMNDPCEGGLVEYGDPPKSKSLSVV
jgi:hypothetical protein